MSVSRDREKPRIISNVELVPPRRVGAVNVRTGDNDNTWSGNKDFTASRTWPACATLPTGANHVPAGMLAVCREQGHREERLSP